MDELSKINTRFNLLRSPWIKCTMKNGEEKTVGLLDMNRNINEIVDVVIPKIANSHFIFYELSLYRFLTVLYSRAIKLDPYEDRDTTQGITENERQTVEKYLLKYENKFNLIDDEYPFMQATTNDIEEMISNKEPDAKSFVTSFVNLPSENAVNNLTLLGYQIEHCEKDEDLMLQLANFYELTPEQAVYHLLYLNAFSKCAGVAGCSSISSTPELYMVLKGSTLGTTIKMNMFIENKESPPIWERNSVFDYYKAIESIDLIGYSFYPNRLCRFYWHNGKTSSMIYAPHKYLVDESAICQEKNCKNCANDYCTKIIARNKAKLYYQKLDRDSLLLLSKDDKVVVKPYNRTENWITMLTSAIVSSNDNPYSNRAAKDIFSDQCILSDDIVITLYGRSVDGKSGVYKYSEKIEEKIKTILLKDPINNSYIIGYISVIEGLFNVARQVVNKFYLYSENQNANPENKSSSVIQQISTYGHQQLKCLYDILETQNNVKDNVSKLEMSLANQTRSVLFKALSEDLYRAAKAWNNDSVAKAWNNVYRQIQKGLNK